MFVVAVVVVVVVVVVAVVVVVIVVVVVVVVVWPVVATNGVAVILSRDLVLDQSDRSGGMS